MQSKVSAPSPSQPFNGQRVLRIPGLKIHEKKVEKRFRIRFGSWDVGRISGRTKEECEEMRKLKVEVCCLREVKWSSQGARFFGVKRRRYKLWWCGNDNKTGGVGILVKKELCENVVEVRKTCGRVMAIASVFAEEVVRIICAYAPQSESQMLRRKDFMKKWRVSGVRQTQRN